MKLFHVLFLFFSFFFVQLSAQPINTTNSLTVERELNSQINVTVLVPEPSQAPFWASVLDVMKAASDNLNIKLDIQILKASQHNRFSMLERFEDIATTTQKPDYFISPLQLGVEKELLEIIEKNQINYISLNSYIPAVQYEKLGRPREHFKHWLGHISPNDFLVGKELAEYLFQVTKAKNKNKPTLNLIGITAPKSSLVGQQRAKGLFKALSQRKEFILSQLAYSNWSREETFTKVDKLLKRHQNISIIWNVSDDIALGSLSAVQNNGLKPGDDVFIGGIDWTSDGLSAIKRGEMEVSFGGHFLDGAKALVLIFDHYNGQDFADNSSTIFETKLRAITQSNVVFFENILKHKRWSKLNFRKFSLFENPARSKYSFEVESFLIVE